MKPTEGSADAHGDFVDESTSVMGGDLLSSLTERSRRIDLAPVPVPEPEISIVTDEVEPVTTMRPVEVEVEPVTAMRPVEVEVEPVTTMRPVTAPRPVVKPQLLVVDGEYPALGDEESTMMMEEPDPTTVAVRKHLEIPAPPPAPVPPPPPPVKLVSVPPMPSAPDPQWAHDLKPRSLPTLRVAPLPAPEMETTPEPTPKRAVGSRWVSVLAALALGVAAWTVGLGHHEDVPPSVMSSAAASVGSVAVTPWDLPTQANLALGTVRSALGSLWSAKAPTPVAHR